MTFALTFLFWWFVASIPTTLLWVVACNLGLIRFEVRK